MKLITGGNGFIGSNLTGDVKISRADVDLRNYGNVLDLIKHYRPTTVIHTAARHGNFLDMMKFHTSYLHDNILIDLNVIKACYEANVTNLLMLSSVTSFPHNTNLPYIEANFFNGDVSDIHYGYSFSKKICTSMCRAYQLEFGLNYKSIILGNVYGPNNHFNTNGTVISKLIFDCMNAKKLKTSWRIYGDGSPVRDFLYVEDLNYIFDTIINSDIIDPIIVSTGELVDIKTIVHLICKYMAFNGEVIWGNENFVGQKEKYSNISVLKNILTDFIFTDIDEGIKKTCMWYTNYTNNFDL